MDAPPPEPTLIRELRAAVQRRLDAGLSMNRLARRCDIDDAMLSRFMSGVRGLRLSTAAKLFDVLRLRVVDDDVPKDRQPPKRPRKPKG